MFLRRICLQIATVSDQNISGCWITVKIYPVEKVSYFLLYSWSIFVCKWFCFYIDFRLYCRIIWRIWDQNYPRKANRISNFWKSIYSFERTDSLRCKPNFWIITHMMFVVHEYPLWPFVQVNHFRVQLFKVSFSY